jgi:hypothetical protein
MNRSGLFFKIVVLISMIPLFTFANGTSLTNVRKLDILFVVDNSGSMGSVQSTLSQHIPNFKNSLSTENFDVKVAYTTTDAFYGDQFIDAGCSICNLSQTKLHNDADVGIMGSGDERAFSSFKAALSSPLNSDFHRKGAFLSIIIVSDADDFSHDSINLDESYSQLSLHPISKYIDFLNSFTNGTAKKDYSVSTIGVLDSQCKGTENKLAVRYSKLSNLTGGTLSSICEPINQSLEKIGRSILVPQ